MSELKPSLLKALLESSTILFSSSYVWRFGTRPLDNILLTSSKNDSCTTSLSENINTVLYEPFDLKDDTSYNSLINSLKFLSENPFVTSN
jgi:hypothetical protein